MNNTRYDLVCKDLLNTRKTWLITGVAGFIGSNLLEKLLLLNQNVIGLDNFLTGHKRNLFEVSTLVSPDQWARFQLIEGDIRDYKICEKAVKGVNCVLHQAALGSVPRSIADPITTNACNISGFINMLNAAKEESVDSFTYAASSSTYGDHPALPKVEEHIGNPLSPYAVTKYVNELYAGVFARTYGFKTIGLRYFNVFGRRQDPSGAYAAVIPKWTAAMIDGTDVFINGDGETSRDFCYIDNVVQMNILSALAPDIGKDKVYNVAVGDRTTLNQLYRLILESLKDNGIPYSKAPIHTANRKGDIRHSQADINKATEYLGYSPSFDVAKGISLSMPWYVNSNR